MLPKPDVGTNRHNGKRQGNAGWLAQTDRALLQLGYIPLADVQLLLERVSNRMSQIDEPLAREYVLDPFPGGIEQKIHRMCLRRKALFARLVENELEAEQHRLAGKDDETH